MYPISIGITDPTELNALNFEINLCFKARILSTILYSSE